MNNWRMPEEKIDRLSKPRGFGNGQLSLILSIIRDDRCCPDLVPNMPLSYKVLNF
jgi:hypothetical protein